jgi:2-polyprenyl-3-methyl-5-hydroxy-6-metoxy-1,4-benzoquinol methylase
MSMTMCPQCGQQAPLSFSTKDYNRRISDERFDYYRCNACAFVFLSPVPGDLGRYYPAQYYDVPRNEAELMQRGEELQRWKLDTVMALVGKGRLLEIGPAYGLFSALAKRAGFEVTAIEMDSRCCSFLRDTVGIQVVHSADTVAALEQLPAFDVIVLWQVIEHLPDPWAVLDAAADRLAPNGVLILDTPNPQAFQFGVLGRYWTHVDAPRHVTLIPAKLLTQHVARSGLEPVLLTAADKGANGFNGFGWAFSFKNFFLGRGTGALAHLCGRVLAKLLIPIERTGWRGSTYTAAFRKGAAQ